MSPRGLRSDSGGIARGGGSFDREDRFLQAEESLPETMNVRSLKSSAEEEKSQLQTNKQEVVITRKVTLIELIALQTTNGSWPASALPTLQAFFKQQLASNLPPDVLCTIAALYVLEEFFADK